MIFEEGIHRDLARLFDPELKYAGYKPNVLEAPNGDGKIDGGEVCPCCNGSGIEPEDTEK